MALLFIDSCGDHYDNTHILSKWDGVAGQAGAAYNVTTGGRTGNRIWLREHFGRGVLLKNLSAGAQTIVMGFAYMPQGFVRFTEGFCLLYESTTLHMEFRTDSSGRPTITRAGTQLAVATDPLVANAWHYIEVKATIHDTTGSAEIRVDNQSVASVSGVDTRNGGAAGQIDRVVLQGGHSTSEHRWFDDVYVLDTAGSANNDFLGDVKVETLFPSGAGSSTDFTPSAGSNYENVDEAIPDNDTTYNASGTAGHKDTFAMDDLATVDGSVKGIQIINRWRKDDAGSRTARRVVRSGGGDYEGSDFVLSDSYLNSYSLLEQDPDTAADWTVSGVNALEAGYKVQS